MIICSGLRSWTRLPTADLPACAVRVTQRDHILKLAQGAIRERRALGIIACQVKVIARPTHQTTLVIVGQSSQKLLPVSIGSLIEKSELDSFDAGIPQKVSLNAGPCGFAIAAAFEQLNLYFSGSLNEAQLSLNARASSEDLLLRGEIEPNFAAQVVRIDNEAPKDGAVKVGDITHAKGLIRPRDLELNTEVQRAAAIDVKACLFTCE